MRLANNAHLSYCTNVHPGKDWEETFRSLQQDVLAVRRNVSPSSEYAIGLRLSASAARELSDSATLSNFKNWLEQNNCYIFTINGFPYGDFHGQPVKELAYSPDWTSPERLSYTKQLFEILAELLPPGVSGSVSTVPGSFKGFIKSQDQIEAIFENLYQVYQHIEKLSQKKGIDLHLGLEPEPLCLFETTPETLKFFDRFLDGRKDAEQIRQRIGVNYDTCHLALQYETAAESLNRYAAEGIRLSKIHLSCALKARDLGSETLSQLESFCEPTYLHQVIAKSKTLTGAEPSTRIDAYTDLPEALAARRSGNDNAQEWRIHFHIPLHAEPAPPLLSTKDHLLDTLDYLAANPTACQHLEMETYTWAVMPSQLHSTSVVDQVTAEYRWLLPQIKARSLI